MRRLDLLDWDILDLYTIIIVKNLKIYGAVVYNISVMTKLWFTSCITLLNYIYRVHRLVTDSKRFFLISRVDYYWFLQHYYKVVHFHRALILRQVFGYILTFRVFSCRFYINEGLVSNLLFYGGRNRYILYSF